MTRDEDLTYEGMRPRGGKWKRARRVDAPTTLAQLDGEIEDLRDRIKVLVDSIAADVAHLATDGTDTERAARLAANGQSIVLAQHQLAAKYDQHRALTRAQRGGSA